MISNVDSTIHRIGLLDKAQQKWNFQLGGSRLQHGSEDAVLFGRIKHVEDKIRTHEGIQEQIERAHIINTSSDSAISEMKKIYDSIKKELIQANTNTTTVDGLEAIAGVISGYKKNLFDLANTQTEGQYVFSGSDASVRPFNMDDNGKVTYQGDSGLRKIAVDEGSYRERGVNGIDLFYYVAEKGLKGETINFEATDKIIDQDGKEWVLDAVNNTISKTNWDGSKETLTVTPPTPPETSYSVTLPDVDGTRFEARRNVFDMIDEAVNNIRGFDKLGNTLNADSAINYGLRRDGISKALGEMEKTQDAVVIAHAELGARNKNFEVSLERLSTKLLGLRTLEKDLENSNLTEVATNLKALEISYAAVYSTINRTFELSLINFMK